MRIVVPKVPMEPTMCASVDQSPYLVESQGALVVLRPRQCFSSTTKFRAFNVPLEEGFHGSDWLQENSILFLGCHNASFSIRCSNKKNFQCVGNSICFTVDFCECLALTRGNTDASSFNYNMEDGVLLG